MAFHAHSLTASQIASLLDAERRGAPFVAFKDASGDLRLVALDGRERVSVGRVDHNDVSLGWDGEVSRTHAQLELLGGEWTILDDGLSRNGSFVNGERILGRRRLIDGDTLRLGRTTLVFRAPGPAALSTAIADGVALVRLTDSERRVLVALCRPLTVNRGSGVPATNREIAQQLNLSLDGVKTHVRALFAKLAIDDLPQYRKRTELARRAIELGLVTARDVHP